MEYVPLRVLLLVRAAVKVIGVKAEDVGMLFTNGLEEVRARVFWDATLILHMAELPEKAPEALYWAMMVRLPELTAV